MKLSRRLNSSVKVGALVRQRLKELKRSPRDLAKAVQVPAQYIGDLIAGRRRPPLPARTDLYERMTRFLRLARNDLATCARAERDASPPGRGRPTSAQTRSLLLGLCEPATARALEERLAERGSGELDDLAQRLLNVTQGGVMRALENEVVLRTAAAQCGSTYVDMRLKVLEFLDVTPDTLTARDFAEFFRPRIGSWDVDLQTGVLHVVLRAQQAQGLYRRTPAFRAAF